MIARRTGRLVLLLALSLCAALTAFGDKLDDFKTARDKNGCQAIPYGDLRSTCENQGNYVHQWCDGEKGPITCGKGLSAKLQQYLDNAEQHRENLGRRHSELESAIQQANDEQEKTDLKNVLDATDDEIDGVDKSVDFLKKAIDKREKHVEWAINTVEKCIDYREAVMNVFASALDNVRGESDAEIQLVARDLRDKYEAEKRGHEIAITDKKNALAICTSEQ